MRADEVKQTPRDQRIEPTWLESERRETLKEFSESKLNRTEDEQGDYERVVVKGDGICEACGNRRAKRYECDRLGGKLVLGACCRGKLDSELREDIERHQRWVKMMAEEFALQWRGDA